MLPTYGDRDNIPSVPVALSSRRYASDAVVGDVTEGLPSTLSPTDSANRGNATEHCSTRDRRRGPGKSRVGCRRRWRSVLEKSSHRQSSRQAISRCKITHGYDQSGNLLWSQEASPRTVQRTTNQDTPIAYVQLGTATLHAEPQGMLTPTMTVQIDIPHTARPPGGVLHTMAGHGTRTVRLGVACRLRTRQRHTRPLPPCGQTHAS